MCEFPGNFFTDTWPVPMVTSSPVIFAVSWNEAVMDGALAAILFQKEEVHTLGSGRCLNNCVDPTSSELANSRLHNTIARTELLLYRPLLCGDILANEVD